MSTFTDPAHLAIQLAQLSDASGLPSSSSSSSDYGSWQDLLRRHPLFDSTGEKGPHVSAAELEAALPQLQSEVESAEEQRQEAELVLKSALLEELLGIDAVREAVSLPEGNPGLSKSSGALPSEISALEDELMDLVQAFSVHNGETQGASPSSLLSTLEAHQQALSDLYDAKDYYSLLAAAEDLRNEAVAADKSSVGADSAEDSKELAIRKLVELIALVQEVQDRHRFQSSQPGPNPAEEPNLVKFVRGQLAAAYNTLRNNRLDVLRTALRHAGWPSAWLQGAAAASSAKQPNGNSLVPENSQNEVRELLRTQNVRETWFDVCALQRVADGTAWPKSTSKRKGKGVAKDAHARVYLAAEGSASRAASDGSQAGPGQDGYAAFPCTFLLLEPFIQRFAYHFDSDHTSNRLDKPEWFLSHLLDLFKSQIAIWRANGSDDIPVHELYSLGGYDVDTGKELLHVILHLARGKILSSMDMLVQNPALLAHTLFVAMDFDRDLEDTYRSHGLSFPQSPPSHSPLKIAELLLSREEWFEAWLEGEKMHAMRRFEEIMDAPDAWAIGTADGTDDEDRLDSWNAATGHDVHGPSTTAQPVSTASNSRKSTTSAREVVDLLEGVTARYASLSSLEQRIVFITRIQLPILRLYAQRLTRSLESFESLSSAFARHIPGGISMADASGVVGLSSENDMVRGLRGLGRLLKAFLSAGFVRDTLRRWTEQGLFVEISQSLNQTVEGQSLAKGIKLGAEKEEDRELDSASLGSLLRRGLQSGGRAAINLRPLGRHTPASERSSRSASRDAQGRALPSHDQPVGVWLEATSKFGELADRAAHAMEKLVVAEVSEGLLEYSRR